jgi:molecular chaperone DnaJ
VSVQIPSGIADGARIVVPEMGESGLRGAPSGDLYVTVRVQPHEFLHRDGDNLHCQADVMMTRAALGGDVSVDGLRGKVTAHVPAGVQNGDTVIVKGEGMPNGRGGVGDLVVHVNVVVPRKLKKEQRALLEQLSETFGDKQEHTKLHRIRDWLGM